MPFKIVRNDITRVRADAIVNTANPKPVCAGGTDMAIYEAAGKEELLKERKKIGEIARGDAAVTGAFNLNAKYIIHTVGPVWEGGHNHELDILESCYTKSLQTAAKLKCESIAFPLISTGVYGFPKDKALQTAVSAFSKFLLENDMKIILVVFDMKSYQLSGRIMGEIESYIDANYVAETKDREYPYGTETEENQVRINYGYNEPFAAEEMSPMPSGMKLEDEFRNLGGSFHDKLFELIDESHMENKDVWKRANLDRKHFSKIQCDKNYHPKKRTVMALCIALELNLEQSKDLLARADWAFSPGSRFDLIVQKAIIDKQYDIMQLNMTLFEYTNEILGV